MFKAFREAKGRMIIGPMLDQITALLNHYDKRPTVGQWDDPYLYGYFGGITALPLKLSSNGKLSGESACLVQAWGWERLTGIAASTYPGRVLALIDSRDPNYFRGMDAGLLWGALMTGTARPDNPIVREAIENGRKLGDELRLILGGEVNELGDAAGYVMTRDLFSYVSNVRASAA